MELELQVLENRGSLDSGGAAELLAMGGAGPMNEREILITILLILLTTTLFSLSRTGQAVFNAIDSLGAAGRVSVTDGGGGGAEFTIENR